MSHRARRQVGMYEGARKQELVYVIGSDVYNLGVNVRGIKGFIACYDVYYYSSGTAFNHLEKGMPSRTTILY